MNEFQKLRLTVDIGILVATLIVACVVWKVADIFAAAMTVSFILLIAYITQSMGRISADPPKYAVPQFMGRFLKTFVKAGWRRFPLRGFIFGYREVDAGDLPLEMEELHERTPDNGEVKVKVSFIYRNNPKNPIQYFNAGGRATIEEKFKMRAERALREWISSRSEGPQTWRGARESNGLAMDAFIERLFPNKLPSIQDVASKLPQELRDITVEALLKYFTGRPPLYDPKFEKDESYRKAYQPTEQDRIWQLALDDLKRTDRDLYLSLRTAVAKRVSTVTLAKNARVAYHIPDLGIIVKQVNIGNLDPTGKTAEGADLVSEARLDAEAKSVELTAFNEQVEQLTKTMKGDARHAAQTILVQQKIVPQSINETTFGIPQELMKMLTNALTSIFGKGGAQS